MPRPRALATRLAVGSAVAIVALGGGGPAGAHSDHVVAPGEFLGAIAERYDTTVRAFLQVNQLTDPNRVRPGQRLVVPAAAAPTSETAPTTSAPPPPEPAERTHTVAAGEHLSSIAGRYGTTVRAVAAANAITNPNLVRVGRVLRLPAGVAAPVVDAGTAATGSAAPTGPDVTAAPTTTAASSGAGGGARGLPERLLASPERLALRPTFLHWAERNAIPADLLQAMCWMESGWQSGPVSVAGAQGICQFLPSTAQFISQLIGVPLDPMVPEEGIRLGARYLRYLLERTGGDEAAALAGYVQGLRSVAENGRYGETQLYIDTVMALRSRFAG